MAHKETPPPVEYFSFELTGHTQSKAAKRHQYDAGGAPDLFAHSQGLFDQDESVDGALSDESTGVRIDNSTFTGMEDLHEIMASDNSEDDNSDDDSSEDVMGALPEEADLAAGWILEKEAEISNAETPSSGLESAA